MQLKTLQHVIDHKNCTVYRVMGQKRTDTTNKDITEYIITSSPFIEESTHKYFFFTNGIFNMYSCNDLGINLGNTPPYNLNRIFSTKEEAEKFVKELQLNEFSDELNKEYALRHSVYDDLDFYYSIEN